MPQMSNYQLSCVYVMTTWFSALVMGLIATFQLWVFDQTWIALTMGILFSVALTGLTWALLSSWRLAQQSLVIKAELACQSAEKIKLSEELALAKKELAYWQIEKYKRAEELTIANAELIFQEDEKYMRAEELRLLKAELGVANTPPVEKVNPLKFKQNETDIDAYFLTLNVGLDLSKNI